MNIDETSYFKTMAHAVGIKRLMPAATMPMKATKGSSGYDLYSIENFNLQPGQYAAIGTGIALSIPYFYEVQIRPRSGLAYKNGITVLNTPGTIDSDYTGEIKVILINHGHKQFLVEEGMRIAQMVVTRISEIDVVEIVELPVTERGDGGFGSTGIK